MLKLEEVRRLSAQLHDSYDQGTEEEGCHISFKQVEDLVEVLKWTVLQLEQRKKNTRAYLIKDRIRRKLLTEHLSKDELESINLQAREAVERGE